jgi:hypothetical protein
MSRDKKPRTPTNSSKPLPKFRCIGGPKDGELLSVLDLPMRAVIEPDGAGGMRVRRDHYVYGAERAGERVWEWREFD